MPVNVIFEEEQTSIIVTNNRNKKKQGQIPVIPRNPETGWPLLQVSLFTASPNSDGKLIYEHALGGGKCHYFFIGAFNLATLLAQIPGKTIIHGRDHNVNLSQFRIDNVNLFLDEFDFHHVALGIKISSTSGSYGKILKIKCPEGDGDRLGAALDTIFSFALKPDSGLSSISGWSSSNYPGYSPIKIAQGINPEVAVFVNGQIFVDFGMFLDKLDDSQLKEYFSIVFRVNEFNQLQSIGLKSKLLLTQNNEVEQELKRVLYIAKTTQPEFNNLYFNIEILKNYGLSLRKKDKEAADTIVFLAEQMEAKTDAFYKKMIQEAISPAEFRLFKSELKEMLYSQDKLMSGYHQLWKPILGNALVSLTGVGLIALAAKVGINAVKCHKNEDKVTLNNSLFFAKNIWNKVEKAINKAPEKVTFSL